MKKFLVVIAVLALTMVSSVAMAEITFDGSIEFLMRSLKNTDDWNDDTTGKGDFQNTYERLRFGINAKHENVKGRIQIETDWDTWADGASATNPNPGFETRPTNDFYAREAWLDFTIPGAGPAHVKVGRQFLQLGNGWWFRSGKYGSDAWVIGLPGKNTVAFVNVKASENDITLADDTDAYVLLDTYKIDDNNAVGAYIAHVVDRRGTWTNNAFFKGAYNADRTELDNIGVHYNGKVGPVKIAAEVDFQMGEISSAPTSTLMTPDSTTDFSGMQVVVQAGMAMDALNVRATVARGTGDDQTTDNDIEQIMTFLDKDPHYTLVYEYFMKTAAGGKNTGFANTLAYNIGADYKINNMFTVGADFWMLQANKQVALNGGPAPDTDLGNEIDVKLNIKLYDQLTWNTTLGYFMPGAAYDSTDPLTGAAVSGDDVQAIQSVLSYKF